MLRTLLDLFCQMTKSIATKDIILSLVIIFFPLQICALSRMNQMPSSFSDSLIYSIPLFPFRLFFLAGKYSELNRTGSNYGNIQSNEQDYKIGACEPRWCRLLATQVVKVLLKSKAWSAVMLLSIFQNHHEPPICYFL